jgi:hypothetical protein
MLKMMTFFQSLPSQQPMPETFHFPGSPPKLRSVSEAESETSMSEASSEDLMPPLLAGVAPGGEEEDTAKKEKKKPKGLANMFSVFTKGKKKKKKGQPSSTEPESEPKTKPELDGPMPTGRGNLSWDWGPAIELVQAWAGLGLMGEKEPHTQNRTGR